MLDWMQQQRKKLGADPFHVGSVSHYTPLIHAGREVVIRALFPSSTVYSFAKEMHGYLCAGKCLVSRTGILYTRLLGRKER